MAKKNTENENVLVEEVTTSGRDASAQATENNIQDFITKYKTPLLGGLAVIVLAIVGAIAYNSLNASKANDAENAAFQAMYYWEKDSLNKALNGDGKAQGLIAIADEYSGTEVGNQAKYMAGIALLKQGKTEEGISYLKDFSKGDNLVSASAYMALGFAHEDLGKNEEAADYFEKAASISNDKDDQMRPFMLKHAGEAYEAAGKKDKALGIYKQIKEKYPNSQEAQTIDKYIGRSEG